MTAKSKRITFTVTKEMEAPLSAVKRELFYESTRSDMIRELIYAGLRASESEKAQSKNRSNPPP